MLHSLVSALASNTTTTVSSAICSCSLTYIHWKMRGGNLLFRSKKSDDASASMFKAILAFGFTYGALLVAMGLAAVSAVVCVLSLLAKLFV
jgi:hypothetical protein